MTLNKEDFSLSIEEKNKIEFEIKEIKKRLDESLKKNKIQAEIFIGGSFPKGTLLNEAKKDVDVFIRFKDNLSKMNLIFDRLINSTFKKGYSKTKIHGSRDYYRISKDNEIIFEIIPVKKISKTSEADNVMDLSYFHVKYVLNKLKKNKNLAKEIRLTKKFCKANNVYGAESYINGFSGYAIECLIIHYKSFNNFLKAVLKFQEKIIIDDEKRYKNKSEIMFKINESKLRSPIVLIDPTWKERNVLSALSDETFLRFKEIVKQYLKKPSIRYFEEKVFDANKFKSKTKKNEEFLEILLETNKQEGDIAGTKLKKFYNFLLKKIEERYKIKDSFFEYYGNSECRVYLIAKLKEKIIVSGPLESMEKYVKSFKEKHKEVYIKDKRYYTEIKINESLRSFVKKFFENRKNQLKEMSIIKSIIK
jgi:tRNA nucleotidyltransferase (CCA-adding enzyme)